MMKLTPAEQRELEDFNTLRSRLSLHGADAATILQVELLEQAIKTRHVLTRIAFPPIFVQRGAVDPRALSSLMPGDIIVTEGPTDRGRAEGPTPMDHLAVAERLRTLARRAGAEQPADLRSHLIALANILDPPAAAARR